jgi:hypothetical protein
MKNAKAQIGPSMRTVILPTRGDRVWLPYPHGNTLHANPKINQDVRRVKDFLAGT